MFDGEHLPRPLKLKIAKTGENIKVDVEMLATENLTFTSHDISMDGQLVTMAVQGPQHLLFELQHSTNLVDWFTVSTQAFTADQTPVEHEPEWASPVHFYRLIWAE